MPNYQKAASLEPKQPEIYINFGRALEQRGQFEEAMACYERALALKPDSAEARYNRSLLLLLSGDLAEGWAEYERRWRLKANPERSDLPQPRWSGEPSRGRPSRSRPSRDLAIRYNSFATFRPSRSAEQMS